MDKIRAEFEAWAAQSDANPLLIRADHNGKELDEYHFPLARAMWDAWQAAKPDPCEWVQDEWDNSYDTSCGNKYEIIDGTPDDNGMNFCTYCGGKLEATTTETQGKREQ